jgi:hypothetical protein
MSWCPPWVAILILAGGIPFLLGYLLLRKRTDVRGPFCDQHKGHWLYRELIPLGTFALLAIIAITAVVILAMAPQNIREVVGPFVCLAGVGLFLVWLVALIIMQNTAIRPREIAVYEITLTGVCDAFVDAVEEADRKPDRAARRNLRRRYDYDPDDHVPRPVRPVDAFQEDEPRPRRRRRGMLSRSDGQIARIRWS